MKATTKHMLEQRAEKLRKRFLRLVKLMNRIDRMFPDDIFAAEPVMNKATTTALQYADAALRAEKAKR